MIIQFDGLRSEPTNAILPIKITTASSILSIQKLYFCVLSLSSLSPLSLSLSLRAEEGLSGWVGGGGERERERRGGGISSDYHCRCSGCMSFET